MDHNTFGKPIVMQFTKQAVPSKLKEESGVQWGLSKEALKEIEELEENSRMAEKRIGSLLIR